MEREKAAKANSPRRSPVTHGPTLGPSGTDQRWAGDYPTRLDFTSSFYAVNHYEAIRIMAQWGTLQSHCIYSVVMRGTMQIVVLYRTKTALLGDTSNIHHLARDLHARRCPLHAHHSQLSRAHYVWPVHRLVFALRPTPPDKLRNGSRQSK